MNVKRKKIWIYKWDKSYPGKFYGISESGKTIKGEVNLSLETDACNWLLVFIPHLNYQLQFFKFMNVKYVVYDSVKDWWCANTNIGPYEFVNRKHVYYGAFVYFNSLQLHKYAKFIYDNRKLFGIEDVAFLYPDKSQLFNSQYFIQKLRQNNKFSPIGLFQVEYQKKDKNMIYVCDPFKHILYESSEFKYRPNFKILSFDLEIAITNGRGGFPNGLNIDEKIVGVSMTFSEMDGQTGNEITGSRKTELWLLVPPHIEYTPPLNNRVAITVFTDECDMLLKYLTFTEQFHIIIGYNSNTFDNNILIARCLFLNIPLTDRNINLSDWLTKNDFEDIVFVLQHQDNIDLISYFKRYYQGKQFTSYKLDDVAETVLGRKKVSFEVYKIHKLYSDLFAGSKDTHFLDDLCEYMETDSQLPLDLFYKENILNLVNVLCILTFCNTHNIFGPISVVTINCVLYTIFYPEKKPFSYEKNIIALSRYNSSSSVSNKKIETYQGAHIIEPIPGSYTNVMVFDYASLYPSNIIKYNISPTYLYTISKVQYAQDKLFFDEHFYIMDMSSHLNLTPKKETTPLASIETTLMSRRGVHKNVSPANPYDTVMQQALKLLANALYGLTGAQTFISDQAVAATVTAYGRQSLQRCEEFFKLINFDVLYGDTDSVFVCKKQDPRETECNVYDKEYSLGLIEQFYAWNESRFPKLEIEDVFRRLVIISKKCYVGLRNNGQYKVVGFQKKIPKCMSLFIADLIDFIFKEENNNVNYFQKWMKEKIQDFINLTQKSDEFVQMKKVKVNLLLYSKKCNLPQLVFARELQQRGIDLSTLDGHIYYVIVIKDIISKYAGSFYELSKDAANLRIDLHSFVSTYIGKLKGLLNVVYGLDKRYLDKVFSDATNQLKNARFNSIKTNRNISIWSENKAVLQRLPNVKQFFRTWYDFAIRYHLFQNNSPFQSQIEVFLKWIPNHGFTYLDKDHISEWKSLVAIEKHFRSTIKIQPLFKIVVENDWTIKDFLTEILNLSCPNVQNESDIYVTRYGVFDIRTELLISDCIEKTCLD